MADTAQVLIQIRGDVGDINAKLSDLRGNIGKINKDMEGVGKIGKLSWAAFSAGVAGAVYAAQQAINTLRELAAIPLELAEAFGKQEEAENKLTAVLAAHGVTNRDVTKAYVDMATEIQRTTKYSDDLVLSAQALLTSMGVLPSQMKQAIDTTTILATRTGSLDSAAQALGQALNGNYRGLRQIIPALKGAEEGAFSANQIFSMIRETLGNTAQAEAEGYIGKIKKLNNAWDDLKETLGEHLIPTITELVEGITRSIHAIEGLLGVTTTVWKKKELDILEKAIADYEARAKQYEGLTAAQEAMLAIGGDTRTVYKGLDLDQAKARAAELKAELKGIAVESEKVLKDADKSFKSPKSHLYDELMRQWALASEKLQGEIDTANMDNYQKALVRIEVTASKLRDQFAKVKMAGPLIDAWEAAMKYEAEMENLLQIGEKSIAMEEKIKKNREQQLNLLLEMSRLELRRQGETLIQGRADLIITESEYLRGQIRITEELLRLEKERQDQIDTTDEENLAMWLSHEAAIESYREKLNDLVRAERDASAGMVEGMVRGMKEYRDEAGNAFKDSVEGAKRAFRSMEDSLIEFVKTGKLSFKDLVDSILTDLLRLTIRQNITGPMAAGLSVLLGGPLTSLKSQFDIASLGGNDAVLAMLHTGGIAGSEGSRRSFRIGINPAVLPRYHSGIGPDEQMAVLRKDEGVFTPGQMRAIGTAIGNRDGQGISIGPFNFERGDSKLAATLERRVIRIVEQTIKENM